MGVNKKTNSFITCLAAVLILTLVQNVSGTEKTSPGTNAKSNLTEDSGTDQHAGKTTDHQIVVYYFHGNKRCFTCKKIERLTREAVFEFFDGEIKSSQIKFQVINVDEPENRHYTKKYQLFTKSVVVSDIKNGTEKQWKNLQKIWELVHNDEAFKEYICDEIKGYLL